MLRYMVIRKINGGTDWYDLAAFEFKHDADLYANEFGGEGNVEVREVRQVKCEFVD